MNNSIDAFIGEAALLSFLSGLIKTTELYTVDDLVWNSRVPVPVQSLAAFTYAFPLGVWLSIVGSLFVFGLLFLCIHDVYSNPRNKMNHLVVKEEWAANFFILAIFGVTEDNHLPWFKRQSAG